MPAPGHVLVVCTANICRSPMAAGLLRHALDPLPEPLRSLRIVSAGLAARPGEPVTPHSVAAMRKAGIDISGHLSRRLSQDLLNGALAVFCMTEAHRMMIQAVGDPPPKDLHLFREFMADGSPREIPDPFGGPLPVYEASRDEMVEAVPSLVRYLRSRLGEG